MMSREGREGNEVNERVSYWLVPVEADDEELRYLMCDIDGWIPDAPFFDPHVTLYSGPLSSRDNVPAILESATRGVAELTLRSSGISHSEEFTKTLFIEFEKNDVVFQISDALKKLSARPSDYELKPHLSLVYANLSAEIRKYFAEKTELPSFIRFNGVKANV